MIQAIKFYCSMKICIVSHDYPDKNRSVFTFVAQLVEEMARLGNECYVVAPYSVTKNKNFCKKKEVKNVGAGSITIIRPKYISVSTFKINSFSLSNFFYFRAVERALKNLPTDIDCIYGHFWQTALCAYRYAKKQNIPLFVATGESEIPKDVISEKYKEFYDYVSGVICVSSKNREESIAKGLTSEAKCVVLPNAVNSVLFHKDDKSRCREQLGISQNHFIVAFVGWFDDRKGVVRVSQAIDKIQDGNIYSFFIGSGGLVPTCDNILFKGRLPHDKIAIYLNAADVFVLPTLREGCCNAIVEAMACGLPIVSSDLSFNYDVLNKDNSIMIDPKDVDAIAKSIHYLYANGAERNRLAENSLQVAQSYTISNRARRVVDYIQSNITV